MTGAASGSTSLELRVLSRVSEVPKETWDACVGEAGSPFVEWTWLDCMEEAGCVGGAGDHAHGWTPAHLELTDVGGPERRLLAFAPGYVKTNSEGEFVFDWSWADLARRMGLRYYPKLLVAAPFSPVTGERVLVAPGADRATTIGAMAAAVRTLAVETGCSSAHALFLREEEARGWESAGYMRRSGVQYHWHNQGYGTFEDFLSTFKSKRRNQIRREAAQPDKDGVRIETLRGDRITPEIVHAMYRFYLTTVDKFVWGRRYLNERFFELVAERFRDRLAWVMAFKGDEPIAGAFNVQKGDRLYGRYWGATAELPFLHFNVCYYHGIRECIAQGLSVFEPGAGGEHKLARGFRPTEMHSAHYVHNARLRHIVEDFVLREREAVARFVADPSGEEP
ncbi:MAG TPA: GNAT family N-acetyltransferase [Polyangiaceae bacterium]|nr:GNAT family N-acetyltransferase [Polyangiaceae bacterium]